MKNFISILSIILLSGCTTSTQFIPSPDFKAQSFHVERHRYNEFITRFKPFKSTLTPSQRVRWMRDNFKYCKDSGYFKKNDVWQLPEQLMRSKVGDCEDFAVFLASWLIDDGYNAFVSLGTRNGVGHAWVSLETQILDVTKKKGRYTETVVFNDKFITERK